MRVTGGSVLVIGLGRSGRSVVDFLLDLRDSGTSVEIAAADEANTPALSETAATYRDRGVDVRLGVKEAHGAWDLIVVSPGVPPASPLLESATALGAPVVSEIELAYGHSTASFVAVTGTNGKTTTALMVAHLLRSAGISAEAVGNIDPPALAIAPGASANAVMVCEASSFQLASIVDFHPRVAVLLNVTPDHVEWHGSLERYVSDKTRVFENLDSRDLAVIVVDDAGAAPFAERVEGCGVPVCRVSLERLYAGGASVVDGTLVLSTPAGEVSLLAANELLVRGVHNTRNALAAAAAALAVGASHEAIASGLRSFSPVEHRLEPVDVIDDVEYVNDSKATNQEATLAGLSAFSDRPVVLLLGGYRTDGATFTQIAGLLPGRARAVVAFGAAAGDILRDVAGAVPLARAEGLAEAVRLAADLALPGDVVLLSPSCKSFDEFSDYEERGRVFRTLVSRISVEREADA